MEFAEYFSDLNLSDLKKTGYLSATFALGDETIIRDSVLNSAAVLESYNTSIINNGTHIIGNYSNEIINNATPLVTYAVHQSSGSHPGYGALVALLGLSAVAFIVVRRH